MNRISHINRNNTKKRSKKPGFAMSKENLEMIKEVLANRLGADVIMPEDFEAGELTIEEALKEEEDKL